MQVGQIIELFIIFLTWPNLKGLTRPLSPFFHPLIPPVGGSRQIFERTVFERRIYPGYINSIITVTILLISFLGSQALRRAPDNASKKSESRKTGWQFSSKSQKFWRGSGSSEFHQKYADWTDSNWSSDSGIFGRHFLRHVWRHLCA
jgi:hypothetical protein